MTALSHLPVNLQCLVLFLFVTGSSASAQPQSRPDPSAEPTEEMKRAAREYRQRGAGGDSKAYKKNLSAARKALKAGRLPEAERQFRMAVHEAEGFAPTDKRVLESLEGWAEVLMVQRKFRQVQRVYEDIVAFRQRAYGANHESMTAAWIDVGVSAALAGRFSDSEKAWNQAKEATERRFGEYHPAMGVIWAGLGNTYAQAGKPEQAEPAFQRALQLLETRRSTVERSYGGDMRRVEQKPNYLGVAAVLNDQGLFYEAQKRFPEAEAAWQRALSIYERELGKKSESVAMVASNLGEFYRLQKRLPEAEQMIQRSLAIREKTLGPKHLLVADGLQSLAALYEAQGRTADAARLRQRGSDIRSHALGSTP